MTASTKTSWSAEEARQFLGEAAGDRLHAAWLMAMYGGRREEICGAQWEEDINLAAGTWTIATVRVVVDGKVIVKAAPKSERGARTLPLPGDLVAALTALHKRQAEEKLAAGEAYRASGYVVCDELGEAVNPEWVSDEFGRVRERAGLRRITLHEARHTASSLMERPACPTASGPPGAGTRWRSTRPRTCTPCPRTWPPRVTLSHASTVPPGADVMRLFHRTPASGQILAGGFRDTTGGYMFATLTLTGVWLSDQPLDVNEGAKGEGLLEVTFPDDVSLDDFEVIEDLKPYREWCVPAAFINERAAIRLIPAEEAM